MVSKKKPVRRRPAARQKAPASAPQAIPRSGWTGALSADRSSWQNLDKPEHPLWVAVTLLVPGVAVLLMLLPVGLGIELWGAIAAWLKGLAYRPSSMWTEPSVPHVVALIMGMGAAIGVPLLGLAHFTCFEFDGTTRVLRYRTRRLWFKSSMKVVPFEAILSVRPVLMRPFDVDGHFEVELQLPGEGRRSVQLGNWIPIADLRAHAAWLSTVLQDRVQPTLQHDC